MHAIDEVVLVCRAAEMQGSSDIDIYNQRGQVYFQAKNYRKVGAHSNRPRVAGDLASLSLLPQALEDYSKLTRLNPSDAVRSTIARRTLFHACSPHVHRPCACAPLRRPQSAFCRLGQCYGQLGLVPDALEAYASAVRVSPNVRCPHRPYQRCLALC